MLGIKAVMDQVLSELQNALPGYHIEVHILDPTLVFCWLVIQVHVKDARPENIFLTHCADLGPSLE